MKNKNYKRKICSSPFGVSCTLSFRFWGSTFRFSFLAVCLLAFTALTAQKSQQKETDPNSRLEHQLWQARIGAVKGTAEKNNKTRDKLQRIIEQIRSVKFEARSKTSEPAVAEPLQPPESNEILADTNASGEPEKKEAEPKLPYEPITDKTLQILKTISKHPDRVNNPLELAEVLFYSGNLKEAVIFYEEALSREKSAASNSSQDKAWILFQIGNCLKDDDMPAAAKVYQKLIAECPDSPWAELAKAKDKLIEWYQKEQPHKLISGSRP